MRIRPPADGEPAPPFVCPHGGPPHLVAEIDGSLVAWLGRSGDDVHLCLHSGALGEGIAARLLARAGTFGSRTVSVCQPLT